jgi:hypothetical protein
VVGSEETREGKWMSVRVRGGLAATGGGGQTVSVSSRSLVGKSHLARGAAIGTGTGSRPRRLVRAGLSRASEN